MEALNIDIIDIINNGGFIKCLTSSQKDTFLRRCQTETMKIATLYTANIGFFTIEIGMYNKEYEDYEILHLSDTSEDYSDITIRDAHGIMKTDFKEILQSQVMQLLPEYKVNSMSNIDQTEICFASGSTIIYQDTEMPPAALSNSLKPQPYK